MIHLLSWIARMVIRAIVICVWIFYIHSGILLVMWFASWFTGVQVWPMWILSWGFVGWMWMCVLSISGVVWWASVCGWSVVWSMWCAMVRSMAITLLCESWVLWATPVVVAIIPMLWSGMVSIWIMMTWAAVSVEIWLWAGMTLPVPVLMVVPGAWPGMVAFEQFRLVMLCWCSWRRYPIWENYYNVTILITFKTPNVGAISFYVSLFLALKTSILIIWHHVDHRWWSDGGSQLLYHIKLFNFRHCVAEHLWSLLIYAAGQTMGILQTIDEYPDCSHIICEITPFSLCLESMYICCQGFLFSLLDLHELQGVHVDISITKLQL